MLFKNLREKDIILHGINLTTTEDCNREARKDDR